MTDLLLDTCAVLWLAQGAELTPEARAAILSQNLHVSPISAWEIANLVRKSRISLTLPAAKWFRQTVGKIDAGTPELTIELLADSCGLPGSPPNDPADRILIATARESDMTIMTRDKRILEYSRTGHVRSMVC
ncbi:MAG TPA: type II toxin-antitoxin system VapC family toxin [Pseudolabrys sp.]|nr:type II toxin-antitoxin system VapC family toxin [Pseudolabrys sp.]